MRREEVGEDVVELVEIFPPSVEGPLSIDEFNLKYVLYIVVAPVVLFDQSPQDLEIDLVLAEGEIGHKEGLFVVMAIERSHLFRTVRVESIHFLLGSRLFFAILGSFQLIRPLLKCWSLLNLFLFALFCLSATAFKLSSEIRDFQLEEIGLKYLWLKVHLPAF